MCDDPQVCRDCGRPADVVTSADTYLCDECRRIRAADDPGDLNWMDHDIFVRLR